MPGANYMGGKRNAARARVKDAAGKVQRDHFGKKRFEILRSGLSRGQASAGQPGIARNGARPVPEISLAHARRAVGGGQRQDVSRGAAPCAFTPPRAKNSCQRSPPSSVSSRSKILRVLDAENPEVQRNQVDKILQIPDLLGLSSAPKRNRPHSVARSSESSRDWRTPPHSREDGHRRQSTPSTSAHLTSPFRYQGRRTSPHIPSDPNMAFIPLCLDSSPMGRIDDSGYADSWLDAPENDPREDSVDTSYEPARVPFYPDAAFVAKPSSAGGDPVLPSRRRFDSLESLSSWSGTQSYGHLNLDFSTSPPPEQLPLNLTQARFLSDLPSIERVGIDIQI
ncbi:hypothetical protein C8Q78DRAFT_782650 [Trametes maxima]|nr:hypothetical protein C8Q78DRAFT_782650 [Trametes maxima]